MCVLTHPNTYWIHEQLGSALDCSPRLLIAFITFDFHYSLVMELLSTYFTDSQTEAQRVYVIAQGHQSVITPHLPEVDLPSAAAGNGPSVCRACAW